jgi:hypothetical protein
MMTTLSHHKKAFIKPWYALPFPTYFTYDTYPLTRAVLPPLCSVGRELELKVENAVVNMTR